MATNTSINAGVVAGGGFTYTFPSATSTLYGTGTGTITSAQLATSLTDETGSGANVFATSPTLVTPVLGVATATSINGNTFTTGTYTLTGTAGKTLTFTNSLTLSGTDGTTMTFPTTSKTLAANDGSNLTLASQAIGDILTATSTTAYGRLAAVALGSVLTSAGTTTAPTWSSAPQITTIELGNASDTTLSRSSAGVLAVEGVVIPSISSTNTLTNKRVTPRVTTTASSSTPTPSWDNDDWYMLTALAAAALFTNPSGTPTNGQPIKIRVKDNGTARALTYDTQYRALGITLPTTTVISKTLYLGGFWNSADSTVDIVAVAQQA